MVRVDADTAQVLLPLYAKFCFLVQVVAHTPISTTNIDYNIHVLSQTIWCSKLECCYFFWHTAAFSTYLTHRITMSSEFPAWFQNELHHLMSLKILDYMYSRSEMKTKDMENVILVHTTVTSSEGVHVQLQDASRGDRCVVDHLLQEEESIVTDENTNVKSYIYGRGSTDTAT